MLLYRSSQHTLMATCFSRVILVVSYIGLYLSWVPPRVLHLWPNYPPRYRYGLAALHARQYQPIQRSTPARAATAPTPRLDRKKHRRNPEAAGFGRVGPRNETCGAGPEPTRDAPREPLFPGFTRRRDGTGGEERV